MPPDERWSVEIAGVFSGGWNRSAVVLLRFPPMQPDAPGLRCAAPASDQEAGRIRPIQGGSIQQRRISVWIAKIVVCFSSRSVGFFPKSAGLASLLTRNPAESCGFFRETYNIRDNPSDPGEDCRTNDAIQRKIFGCCTHFVESCRTMRRIHITISGIHRTFSAFGALET